MRLYGTGQGHRKIHQNNVDVEKEVGKGKEREADQIDIKRKRETIEKREKGDKEDEECLVKMEIR